MWDLSIPGIEPVSPALQGGFSTPGLPGKPRDSFCPLLSVLVPFSSFPESLRPHDIVVSIWCQQSDRLRFDICFWHMFGEGNGNPIQYSCLENPMDGGAWQATGHGAAESDMTKCMLSLSHTHTQTHNFTVDWQCSVSFMSTGKWISYTYTYVHSFF